MEVLAQAVKREGGRVIGVTATGSNLEDAIREAYDAVAKISFTDAHYRRDIGIKK